MYPDLLESRLIGERMRRLPQECEPPMDWPEFERRMAGVSAVPDPVAVSRPVFHWRYAALAAGIAGVVAGLAVWSRFATPAWDALPSSAHAELPMAAPDKQYLAQAEVSERWLSRLPVEPAVMRVGTRTAVADLEDRIAWMDDVMSAERMDAVDPMHVVALQRERARLVNSLAQVRYAETLVAAAQ